MCDPTTGYRVILIVLLLVIIVYILVKMRAKVLTDRDKNLLLVNYLTDSACSLSLHLKAWNDSQPASTPGLNKHTYTGS